MSIGQLSLFETIEPPTTPAAIATSAVNVEPWADDPEVKVCLGVRYSAKPKAGWVHVKHLRKKDYAVHAVHEQRILDEAWLHPDDIISIHTNAPWAHELAVSWGFGPRVRIPGAPRGHGGARLTFDLYDYRDYDEVDECAQRNCKRRPKRASWKGCTPEEAADFGGEE